MSQRDPDRLLKRVKPWTSEIQKGVQCRVNLKEDRCGGAEKTPSGLRKTKGRQSYDACTCLVMNKDRVWIQGHHFQLSLPFFAILLKQIAV